jgi:hypothetical protein
MGIWSDGTNTNGEMAERQKKDFSFARKDQMMMCRRFFLEGNKEETKWE